jgi:uncharacterized protein (TIGR02145 family)
MFLSIEKMKKIITIIGILFLTTKFFYATAQTDNTTDEGVEINGVVWSTRNVGMPNTFVDNPEDLGMLYQWNYALGYSSTDPLYTSDGGAVWEQPGVYGSEKVFTNDVCPAGWHTPSYEEMEKLLDTDIEIAIVNNINGKKFIDKDNPDKFIFLPAAGEREYETGILYVSNEFGCYWSSTKIGRYNAYYLFFTANNILDFTQIPVAGSYRQAGFSVRCVKDEDNTTSVDEISSEKEKTVIGWFNLLGQKLSEEPESGIFIILYDNGTSEKIMKS